MSLPKSLRDQIDEDEIYAESEGESRRLLAEDERAIPGPIASHGNPYFARDYIPTDPDAQTQEQKDWLATSTSRPSFERRPVVDYIPTHESPTDRTFEEKQATAEKAAERWVTQYDVNVRDEADKAAQQMGEGQFISIVRSMGAHERNIYLRAEMANRNRSSIFVQLGYPDEGINEEVDGPNAQPDVPSIPATFTGPENLEDAEFDHDERMAAEPPADVDEVSDTEESAEMELVDEPSDDGVGEVPEASPETSEDATDMPSDGTTEDSESSEE